MAIGNITLQPGYTEISESEKPSYLDELKPIKFNTLDLAGAFRGKRYELYRLYKKHESPTNSETPRVAYFYRLILNEHTYLMCTDARPFRSCLWTAKKGDHLVYLFGNCLNMILNTDDRGCLDDSEYFKSIVHPVALKAFEESKNCYMQINLMIHTNSITKFRSDLLAECSISIKKEYNQNILSYYQHCESVGLGNFDFQLLFAFLKGNNSNSIKEMESLETVKDHIRQKHFHKLKLNKPESAEKLFEHVDALQFGNLGIFQEEDCELVIQDQNPNMVKHILTALKIRESAFFLLPVENFLEKDGIISLLEKEGVEVTRILLD